MMKKAFYLGLGVMSMTREKAERYYNEMIEKGDLIITVAFGGGLTWGANLIKWTKTKN